MSRLKSSSNTHLPTTGTAVGTKHVLIADDNRDDHLFMVMAAEKVQIPVEFQFVDDGSEVMAHLARAATAAELPDLIVLDLRMPRMDGHRTLQILKSDPVYMEIPVVILTTSSSDADKKRSLDRGANLFITKPSGFWPMVELVQELGEFADANSSYKAHLDAGLGFEGMRALVDDGLSFGEDDGFTDLADRWAS